MRYAELVMRRRNVAEFVKANPFLITLKRKGSPTRTPAGGVLPGTETTLPEQEVRIVQNVRRYTSGIVNSEMGDVPKAMYLIVARHTLNIEEDDRFVWNGEHYVVTGIHKQRQESILATIDLYGPANRQAAAPAPAPPTPGG